MARRGLLAELHSMAVRAEAERRRDERDRQRAYRAAVTRAQQLRNAQQRAAAQLIRATDAERKRAEKEAREAHLAAMEAEVDRRNAELDQLYDDLDRLLEATLDVDDYVDLNTLRREVAHPPFDRADLQKPLIKPADIAGLPPPTLSLPAEPRGLKAIFGKKKYLRAVERARQEHDDALEKWHKFNQQRLLTNDTAAEEHRRAEQKRVDALNREMERYSRECEQRETEVKTHNDEVDTLINDLAYGAPQAIQEYVSIVMANSAYPGHFQAAHTFIFDADNAELKLRVLVPAPETVPTVKAYKYVKASDEIIEVPLPLKICKERYSGAVNQVALRSLHEVFEADRRGTIKTISLEVGTETIDPATGRPTYVPFVAVGAERDTFSSFELANVVPSATLERLGASVSKNPFDLVAANAKGIRKS